jgi:hypothetical protein
MASSWRAATLTTRAGAVDQQGAPVGIAALADAHEPRFAATGLLPRHDTQPSRHLPAILEILAGAQGGDHRGRGERAEPRNRPELLTRRALAIHRFDFVQVTLDLPIEVNQAVVTFGKHRARGSAQAVLGILQDFRQPLAPLAQSLADHDAVFTQYPPRLIGHRRALLDEVLANPVQHLNVLLLGALQGHKPQVRPADRFTDRFRIVRVILIALDLRPDKGGLIKRTSWPSLINSRAQ